MSKAPPTLGTDTRRHSEIGWDDFATLHRFDDGAGVLYALKAIRRGSLAELVRHVIRLPEAEQKNYVIEKTGDHRLDWLEIRRLAALPDFPAAQKGEA
jgi:hypothetical protein